MSSAYSLRYYLHSIVAMIIFLRILSWEDFVPGGFCPLPMHFKGLLDDLWHFECFFLREDFVLIIYSPLQITFSCGNDWILEDFVLGGFCPGRILSRENFVLYLCTLMVKWYNRVFFSQGGFCPLHTLSIITYILLWQ